MFGKGWGPAVARARLDGRRRPWGFVIGFLVLIAAMAIASGVDVARAQGRAVVRAGLQASGTFSWMLHAIEYFGIDDELGLQIEASTYATKEAAELALMAGDVDVTVDDFVNVVLMRSRGIPVRAVYPYSLALGGVLVRQDSDIRSIADLRGKVIAAASLSDKSLLILRTLAVSRYGFDPQYDSETISAAAPLMTELALRGEVDAVLPFWHFAARMVGSGQFREIATVHGMLEEMGLSSQLPNLVLLARDDMDRGVLATFLRALDLAAERMKHDDGVWDSILEEGLYSLPDRSLMASVRARWEASLPGEWNEDIIRGLVELVEAMVAVAGPELVGTEKLDVDAFSTEFAFGQQR